MGRSHRGGAAGERIVIEGRVIDGDGAPVADACSNYGRPTPPAAMPIPTIAGPTSRSTRIFAALAGSSTDADGGFRFTTIRPGPVPGRGNALQAPHIDVAVFARGLLKQLYTRIYFADEPANAGDPVLLSIDDPAVRQTLIATRRDGRRPTDYRFDVILQGERETAFFDL